MDSAVPKIFLVHMRNERIPELIKGLFVFSTEVEVYWYSHGVAGELKKVNFQKSS